IKNNKPVVAKGTTTAHFVKFINELLDIMDVDERLMGNYFVNGERIADVCPSHLNGFYRHSKRQIINCHNKTNIQLAETKFTSRTVHKIQCNITLRKDV
ncbi:uncharacterized protein BX663DRAFT_439693, partial [Cokeromyces recurvatus]|uniref:uncharacterized protein n=1 Tax=Cokeromyces recurvatus TaxID=90255 RepID=UPI00222112AE